MPTATKIWSPYQESIFTAIEKGEGSLVIEACAGSGKTSTIVEAARRLPFEDSVLFTAFNKRVAEELKKKLPASINVSTLNALGNSAWARYIDKRVEVDAFKVGNIVREMSDDNNREFCNGVKKLVGLAKMTGLVPGNVEEARGIVPDDAETWDYLISEYEVDFGWGDKDKRGVELARRVLTKSIADGGKVIDFNDQLYLPVIFNADFVKYDWVFCDELQDVNALQLEMLKRSLAKRGRFVGVGDSAQAIYGWRGAGTDAMRVVTEEFGAVTLPLSVSYRCPKAVVTLAQAYTPKIELWDQAVEGKVETLEAFDPKDFTPSDVILCRNNAPLVALAFRIIRAGKGCKVLGRDIGTGLVSLVKKMKALSLSDLDGKLRVYLTKERGKLASAGEEHKIPSLEDRVNTALVFVAEAKGGSVDDLCRRIEAMFTEEGAVNCVTLSSIHKSKGLEWERVYILDSHLIGLYGGSQENNVFYVAVTRAQKELYFITSK